MASASHGEQNYPNRSTSDGTQLSYGEEIKRLHHAMVIELSEQIDPSTPKYWSFFKELLKPYLKPVEIESMNDVCEACSILFTKNYIRHGEYDVLLQVFSDIKHMTCHGIIQKYSGKIENMKLQHSPTEEERRTEADPLSGSLLTRTLTRNVRTDREMTTNIKTALLVDIDEKVCVIGMVFGKGQIESYQNKQNQNRTFFMATVADCTGVCKIKIYKSTSESIVLNRTYRFMDIIRKSGGFWCIGSSKITPWAPLENIPEHVVREASYEETLSSESALENGPRKLKEAVTSATSSSVVGKVVQVSPLTFVRNGELPLKFISLKDEEKSTVKVALFSDVAQMDYKHGDVLSISSVFRYKDTDTLSTRISSKVEFLNPESLLINVSDRDFLSDSDFGIIPDVLERDNNPTDFIIVGVDRVNLYPCCDKIGCKKKKLLSNGTCPNCRDSPDSFLKYCYAKCIIKHADKEKIYTIFYDELTKLVKLPETFLTSPSTSNDDLMELLTRNLPVSCKTLFDNGHLSL